jgi:16S rRNA (uracil1498-N3)-methyltransferase
LADRAKTARLFAPDLSGDRVELTAGEAHHALHVLRLKTGAAVELFDGSGTVAIGRIERIGRGEAAVRLERRLPQCGRAAPAVHLAFSVPKGRRLDWLLEKATELGARSLTPVVFARSVAGPAPPKAGRSARWPARRRRWLAHCIAAAKQSGLNFLPQLAAPLLLEDFLAGVAGRTTVVGQAGRDAAALAQALSGRQGGEVHILVGPEGGLTSSERSAVLAAGALPVRLGDTTLRTETAAVALLAATLAILAAADAADAD